MSVSAFLHCDAKNIEKYNRYSHISLTVVKHLSYVFVKICKRNFKTHTFYPCFELSKGKLIPCNELSRKIKLQYHFIFRNSAQAAMEKWQKPKFTHTVLFIISVRCVTSLEQTFIEASINGSVNRFHHLHSSSPSPPPPSRAEWG